MEANSVEDLSQLQPSDKTIAPANVLQPCTTQATQQNHAQTPHHENLYFSVCTIYPLTENSFSILHSGSGVQILTLF